MTIFLCRGIHPAMVLVTLSVIVALVGTRRAGAADSPVGRQIAEIVPINNHRHTAVQILNVLNSQAGKPYNDATMEEDVRRLHATKWFTSGGIQIETKIGPDGRVTVYIIVNELVSTVQEILCPGFQHGASAKDVQTLTGVRKGDPMNPLANELGRTAILRKLQDDGRYYASVELVEGKKPEDTRVIYNVVEGPVVKVGTIEFRGNTVAQSGRLKTVLTTKRPVLGFGGKFNQMTLDMDIKAMNEYYSIIGYLAVRITPEVIPTPDITHVNIVYHIVEGVKYTVAGVGLDGNRTFTSDVLNPLIEVKAGDSYDQRKIKTAEKLLQTYQTSRGYDVQVVESVVETQPGVVQVQYQVLGDKGRPDRVGRVIIQGNEVTQDRVILNQLDLRPGQVLQYPKLEDARIRLTRLGIFSSENPPVVEVLPNEFDSELKDVRVRVEETRTGQFMVGAGINSNNGLNGSIVINERNFDILRFPSSWDDVRYGRAFRGDGEEFRIDAVPATTFQRYSATWRDPYIGDSLFSLTNSLYFFQRQYVEYEENRLGDKITIDRRIDQYWKGYVSMRNEAVEEKNVPWYAPPSISGDAGWHYLLGLKGGVTRDSRDSYLFPTTGSVLDLSVEQVLGSYNFPIAVADFREFFSSKYLQREDGSGKHVLGIRSQIAVEGGDAPTFERFYAGGFGSLRGFTFRGVGPSAGNGLFNGGTFSFLNSVEYMVPLLANDKLHLVGFVDHGTVESSVEIRNYRVAAGFGLRINIPALGPQPIALDFAFPIVKAQQDNKQLFSFYVGVFGGP